MSASFSVGGRLSVTDVGSSKDSSLAGGMDLKEMVVHSAEFKERPLGFSVVADSQGNNALVSTVSTDQAYQSEVKIGYCVHSINDESVLGDTHESILIKLKESSLPLSIDFCERGLEYYCIFEEKPLGFSIVKEENGRNARVSSVTGFEAKRQGVLFGAFVVAVNHHYVFGWKYEEIVKVILSESTPLTCTFRQLRP